MDCSASWHEAGGGRRFRTGRRTNRRFLRRRRCGTKALGWESIPYFKMIAST